MNFKVKKSITTFENTLSGVYVSYRPSFGFYNISSGCLMNIVPLTLPHTIMTVKQWKKINSVTAEYQKANYLIQKIEDLKKEINKDRGELL